MNRMFLRISLAAGLAALAIGAIAQVDTIPREQSVGPHDRIAVVQNGNASAQSVFASPGQISGHTGYSQQTPLTAFAIVADNFQTLLFLTPAGTLATGTLTLPPNPGDGQNFCLQDNQTQTAITISPATGQTIGGGLAALTALVINVRYCWFYNQSGARWVRWL